MKAGGSHGAVAVLASLAILALGAGVIVGPAAGASGGGIAEAAKKCKKKKAGAAKKKKCKKKKKKKKKQGATPAPLVRATLTWDTVADLDLVVFDSSGTRARAAANTIANTAFSANDIDGLGPETFTDSIYVKPGRNFSFGVCFQDGGSNPTNFTLDYVTADGVHHTGTAGVDPLGSDGAHREFAGGAPIPDPDGYCPAP
jgi:hypothetical protein